MMRCFAVAAITLLAPASLASADELDVFAIDSDDVINEIGTVQDGAPRSLSDNSTTTTDVSGTTVSTTGGGTTTTDVSGTTATTAAAGGGATVTTTMLSVTTAAPTPPDSTTTKMPPKPLAVIKGSFGMTVSNAAEFVKDAKVKAAIGDTIANLVNISKDFVNVTLRVVTRRLTMQPRRLAEGSVEADYTITIPEDAPAPAGGAGATPGATPMSVDVAGIQQKLEATTAADLRDRVTKEMADKGVTSFTVQVTSVSAPTVEIREDENATTTRPRAPTDAAVRRGVGIFAASLFALAGLGLA